MTVKFLHNFFRIHFCIYWCCVCTHRLVTDFHYVGPGDGTPGASVRQAPPPTDSPQQPTKVVFHVSSSPKPAANKET